MDEAASPKPNCWKILPFPHINPDAPSPVDAFPAPLLPCFTIAQWHAVSFVAVVCAPKIRYPSPAPTETAIITHPLYVMNMSLSPLQSVFLSASLTCHVLDVGVRGKTGCSTHIIIKA